MIKQLLVNVILFIVMLFLAIQGQSILRAVEMRRALETSPVTYGELTPDKAEYAPGELIKFTYDRLTKADPEKLPLLMLTVDSFENLDTGEIFMATSLTSRIVRHNGIDHLSALRRLSPDCTPGTYAFEGWVSIQGIFPTQPMPYASKKFKVKSLNATPNG